MMKRISTGLRVDVGSARRSRLCAPAGSRSSVGSTKQARHDGPLSLALLHPRHHHHHHQARRRVASSLPATSIKLDAAATPSLSPSSQPAQPGLTGKFVLSTGSPAPLGATIDPSSGAVNFALFSSAASSVTLCLFTEADLLLGRPTETLRLDPDVNKTGDIWHILVSGLQPGLLYGYQVEGPHQATDPEASLGHRYDQTHVVLDPYASTIISRRQYGQLGPNLQYGTPGVLGLMNTWPLAAACVPSLPAPGAVAFDWEGDRPLNLPMEGLVVYEMHVRGFTQDASSGVSAPGTYSGMVQRLDYLQALGVNAVELLPVQEFNELEYYAKIPGSSEYRFNFWGYSTVGYFAPMSRYSEAAARGGDGQAIQDEFKTLVKECHKRGIEVILDVVFNHTAEGNERGPTLSFRGLDNRVYYMLAAGGEYYNYSGCGNTFNCNQAVVRQFIVDCLKHWVQEYHVDGFRFDLASIMTRAHSAWHPPPPPVTAEEEAAAAAGVVAAAAAAAAAASEAAAGAAAAAAAVVEGEAVELEVEPEPVAPLQGPVLDEAGYMTDGAGQPTGTPLPEPPLIEAISEDPVLRNTKLIAEAWDCDGLNQVGAFPHYEGRWAEWNGRYRDVVRNFIKGSDGNWAGEFASAICGSPNLYASAEAPETDWWANNGGRKWRGNRPPTSSINFITAHDGFTLADLVSYNEKHNRANGEDNKDGESHNSSWNCGVEGPSDKWDVKRLRHRQMRNFMAALLMSHGVPMLTMGDEYGHTKNGNNNTYCHDSKYNWLDWNQAATDEAGLLRFTRCMIQLRKQHPELQRTSYVTDQDIQWHGEQPNTPDWSETSRLVAFTLPNGAGGGLYVAFNTSHAAVIAELPRWPGRVWQPLIDTSKVAPYDCLVADAALSQQEVDLARGAASMWIAGHSHPLLPWSCVVLESVPEQLANRQHAAQPGQA